MARLERWEPGAFLEAVSFDGHALGKPRIDRVKVIFISDSNAATAAMLAGEAQLSADTSLSPEQAAILKREWEARGLGTVLLHPNQWRAIHFQFRQELMNPPALADVRIRKALAYGIDKDGLNEAVYSGAGLFANGPMPANSVFGPAIERVITKYPYDPRRSEQLMGEAGYRKGPDGWYASASEGRFSAESRTNAGSDNESELAVMASTWRQAGFDIREAVLPTAQIQNTQARSTFPSMVTNSRGVGESAVASRMSREIPNAENRWTGSNHGGWSNAEYDRLVAAFGSTLDPNERAQQVAQALKIYTEDVGGISLFFPTQAWTPVTALRGLQVVAPESNMAWNIHEWQLD